LGKGVLVTPTVDGNLLIGPNAVDLEDKTNLDTTREGIDDIIAKAQLSIQMPFPMNMVITSFSGNRAHTESDDFIIEEAADAKNFINVASIASPGLSSAPSIAVMVVDMITNKLSPEKNLKFNPIRKGIRKFREMSNEERKAIIKEIPEYGTVICRCETVTEGEILDAIRRPLGAKTLDGVKLRTRAGMGRCQSGFCSTKVVDILAKELNIPL
ncbi:FAD-dependent oxidoreductase, partial [Clostridium frigoriphilum]